ncbi:MAG: endonuclease MutS2 [Armatimonadota bacterium]|jgi:DNA mismatch repair protein MutS2
MDTRTLRVLEYEAIRECLTEHASSSLGKELASRLEPQTDAAIVRHLVAETSQARALLSHSGRAPLGGVRDVRAQVMNASRGGVLSPRDLLDITDTLYACRRMRAFLQRGEIDAPLVVAKARELGSFQEIEQAIEAAIDNRAEVMDNASDQLRAIRAQLQRLHSVVAKRLEAIIHNSRLARVIQDPIVTLRNGRYCVPIRSEFKSEFRGIVHDTSSSGATVFMEPFVVVAANNELRETKAAEEHEVRRILAKLSLIVGESADPILDSLRTLAELDLIFARASLAKSMDATEPDLNTQGKIDMVRARHPLLTGDAVPIDIRLGEEFSGLIITGPNTGGKTVSLKTVGLLALMAQSGLHIPAGTGSRVAIFKQVFADIGDEQSIQQSLSTFSSHMSQIVNVLRLAGGDTLVLLDEIGAGTDPAEGSALAKAVMIELLRRGCRVMATTHYGELKTFAYTEPNIQNASVEFDPVTLEPTYEVRIGTPGSSNAFAIASRLGMSASLLRQAAEMMGESQVALHEVIQRAERDQRDLAGERREAAKARMELERTRSDYQRLLDDLKRERREQLRQAREEARRIISRAKQRTEELFNLLRQSVQEAKMAKDAIEREAEQAARYAPPDLSAVRVAEPAGLIQSARAELAEISDEAAEATAEIAEPEVPPEPEPEPEPVRTVAVGEAVIVKSIGQRGSVLAPPDDEGQVEVQVGILRVIVGLDDLVRAPEAFVTVSRTPPELRVERGPVPRELHLRGLRVEAAVYELERYLDRAAVVHHDQVRIVHGKGTGAVRAAVHERLKQHPLVKSFHLAEQGEGDSGVTVVELGEA